MNCKKCSFGESEEYVPGEGSKKANLAIIGESPGSLEVTLGAPFVGESGGLLNWFLRKSGIVKNQDKRINKIWIDNVIRCSPVNGDISVKHLQACRHRFASALYKVKPRIILALGANAAKSVLKDYSANIMDIHSFWQYSEEFNCQVMPAFHPAKVLRNWGDTSVVLRNFEKVAKALKYGVPEQQIGKYYSTVNTLSKVHKLFKFLNSKKRVAFDLESTSAKYYENSEDIIGFSFSWKSGHAAWLPLFGEGRKEIWNKKDKRKVVDILRNFLENKTTKKDGTNFKFDINFSKTLNINVQNLDWDVMQVHHLIDENTPANLTYLTSYYDLNFPRYESEINPYIRKHPTLEKSKTYDYIPEELMAKYACADADATFRISKIQRKIVNKRQKHLYYALSVPLSKISGGMEYRGALIDVKRIGKLEKKYEKEIEKKSTKFAVLCNVDSINVQSPLQMQKLLFETLKFKCTVRTPKGNPSTGKDTIELLKRDTESKKKIKILNYVTEIRKMRKLKATYLTGFRKLVDKNNRLHTNYLTTGTVTGRPASIQVNLQNVPRDPIFRSLFISGKNRRLVIADYSQVEDRLMAFFAGEKHLLDKYRDAKFDPHTLTSAAVRGKKPENVTKEERSFDKAIKFGMNYGRSASSIAETYDMKLEDVEEFMDNYFKSHPAITKYREENVRISKKKGYLENDYGRRRHFSLYDWLYSEEMDTVRKLRESCGDSNWVLDSIESGAERQALNFPIQSAAFGQMILGMERLRKKIKKQKLFDSYLVMQVYDCVIVDCSKGEAKKIKKIVEKFLPFTLYQKKLKMNVTFPADVTVAKFWDQ